jgi:hypothetical protein
MTSMQCNLEFGYQLNICTGTKGNNGIKYAIPNISPCLCCFFFFFLSVFFFENIYKLFLQTLLSVYDLNKHQTVYNTCGGNEYTCAQICLQIYICNCDSLIIHKFGKLNSLVYV